MTLLGCCVAPFRSLFDSLVRGAHGFVSRPRAVSLPNSGSETTGNRDPASPPPEPIDPQAPPSSRCDCHRLSSDNGNSSSTSTIESLSQNLRNAYTKPVISGDHFLPKFVPISTIEVLVNFSTVQAIVEEEDILHHGEQAQQFARLIYEKSRRLLAILVILDKGTEIGHFMREGIYDCHLPFVQTETNIPILHTKDGQSIKSLSSWGSSMITKFVEKQHRMLTPVFREREHYELVGFGAPPFIECASYGRGQGSFSEVSQARIHPDHHDFGDRLPNDMMGPLVAVKRLFDDNAHPFETEKRMLRLLGLAGHLHLVSMLCSYKKGGKYHFVFPWADETLRSYWLKYRSPGIGQGKLLWSLQQMAGITGGLARFHDLTDAEGGDPLFGRHGDLKADNILWFEHYPGYDDPNGLFQITDLGLARVHRRSSRSDEDPRLVKCPSTYSPPDAKRKLRVSRAWDQWSLGCMFLEFITWLLRGSDAIEQFSHERAKDDLGDRFNADYFFTTDLDGVRPAVHMWVHELHSEKTCPRVLHDFLDLIMSDMVVLNPAQRRSSHQIRDRLHDMLQQAENDPGYLTDPITWNKPVPLRASPPQPHPLPYQRHNLFNRVWPRRPPSYPPTRENRRTWTLPIIPDEH